MGSRLITTFGSDGRRQGVVMVTRCDMFGTPIVLSDGSKIQGAELKPAGRGKSYMTAYVEVKPVQGRKQKPR